MSYNDTYAIEESPIVYTDIIICKMTLVRPQACVRPKSQINAEKAVIKNYPMHI